MKLRYPNLVEMLLASRATFTFVAEDDSRQTASMAELVHEAARLAGTLRERGVQRDERVAIMLPRVRDFIVSFAAVTILGAIPCPLAPPVAFSRSDGTLDRLRAVLDYLRCRAVVAEASAAEAINFPARDVVTPQTFDGSPIAPATPRDAEQVALIQCTSGSTGQPKGVVLSHRNILANTEQMGRAMQAREDDVGVCWLPMNHDMGLIGCLMTSLYWGLHLVLIPPTKFLRRPATWLQAISNHRGTISPAPNFAYEYATRRIKEDECAGLDLSSWRLGLCGSEPVSSGTLRRFAARFAQHGLRPNAIIPCYGLAECTLAVSIGTPESEVSVDQLNGSDVVSCGPLLDETRVRIIDSTTGVEVPEGGVGRIAIQSPALMQGYFEKPAASAEVLRDGWLDSGDLGYLRAGRLYVTGREKDCIIVRGACYAPTAFEWAAEEVDGVRRGSVAALGVIDPALGTEVIHLVCETNLQSEPERERLKLEVIARVSSHTGVPPARVHLLRPGSVPKTTSGKVRRREVHAWLAQGQLG